MTDAPLKPCDRPGCGKLHAERGRKCAEHEAERTTQRRKQRHEGDHRGNSSSRGYGAAWQRMRAAKLRRDPLCERCKAKGRTRAANTVHHKDHDPTNNAEDNHESLCRGCHEAEHGRG